MERLSCQCWVGGFPRPGSSQSLGWRRRPGDCVRWGSWVQFGKRQYQAAVCCQMPGSPQGGGRWHTAGGGAFREGPAAASGRAPGSRAARRPAGRHVGSSWGRPRGSGGCVGNRASGGPEQRGRSSDRGLPTSHAGAGAADRIPAQTRTDWPTGLDYGVAVTIGGSSSSDVIIGTGAGPPSRRRATPWHPRRGPVGRPRTPSGTARRGSRGGGPGSLGYAGPPPSAPP